MKITDLTAREIIASGGTPSIEVNITLDGKYKGVASVSFGASAGSHEAFVLFDTDPTRYDGRGMLKAVDHIQTTIKESVLNQTFDTQRLFDHHLLMLDGTQHKSHLGGNTLLGVSLAYAYACAASQNEELFAYFRREYSLPDTDYLLPKPMMVVIEGGAHADLSTDFQEYLVTITKNDSCGECIRTGLEIYQDVKKILKEHEYSINVGNEGAFAPSGIRSNEKPIDYIARAIESAGYKPMVDAGISLDVAASEFSHGESYKLSLDKKSYSSGELVDYIETLWQKYPLMSVEDVVGEDDWDGWTQLVTKAKDKNVLVVGDDVTVTNVSRIQKAVASQAITGVVLKFNQAGTVTETVDAGMEAKKNGVVTIPSHRGGGETNDTSLVDLAVALNSRWIKVGPTRGERVCKYNRLMEIEHLLAK